MKEKERDRETEKDYLGPPSASRTPGSWLPLKLTVTSAFISKMYGVNETHSSPTPFVHLRLDIFCSVTFIYFLSECRWRCYTQELHEARRQHPRRVPDHTVIVAHFVSWWCNSSCFPSPSSDFLCVCHWSCCRWRPTVCHSLSHVFCGDFQKKHLWKLFCLSKPLFPHNN